MINRSNLEKEEPPMKKYKKFTYHPWVLNKFQNIFENSRKCRPRLWPESATALDPLQQLIQQMGGLQPPPVHSKPDTETSPLQLLMRQLGNKTAKPQMESVWGGSVAPPAAAVFAAQSWLGQMPSAPPGQFPMSSLWDLQGKDIKTEQQILEEQMQAEEERRREELRKQEETNGEQRREKRKKLEEELRRKEEEQQRMQEKLKKWKRREKRLEEQQKLKLPKRQPRGNVKQK
ncbi:hypothetical protein L9F63_025321 [Diploptera punctata]|uniref:Uncharacterized protein n=1 Tax=Diploptera punctata TaxID=6984 RepID=A0AAD7ZAH9_DIPPU|nr:hypothetical protein L9F63_025321 [Diploptera punctata]